MTLRYILIVILWTATVVAFTQDFWAPTPGPFGQAVWTMFVTSGGDYYAGTGDGKVFKKENGIIYWDLVYTSPTQSSISLLSEHPDGSIYIGDDERLVKSNNDGGDWVIIDNQTLYIRSMTVAANGDVYFGSSQGIFRSQNNGPLEPIEFENEYPNGKWIFSLATGPDGVLYAGTARHIYKTIQIDQDTVIWEKETVQTTEVVPTFYNFAVSANGDIYATTDFGLFADLVSDGIDEWVEVGADFILGRKLRNVLTGPNNRVFININGDGIQYSDNGTDWVYTGIEPILKTRPGIFYDAIANKIIAGTWDGVWSAPYDDLSNFEKIGLPPTLSHISSNQPKLFTIESENKVLESLDAGATWTEVTSVVEGTIQDYCEQINGFKYVAAFGGIAGKPVLRVQADPLDDQWYSIGLPDGVTYINDLYIDSNDDLLLATDQGLCYFNLDTFEITVRSELGTDIDIYSLAEDGVNILYACTSNGLYTSQDHGNTWSMHLEGITVNGLGITNLDEFFAATNEGLFYFANLNDNGQLLGDDISMTVNQKFESVSIDDSGRIYTINEDGVYYADNKGGTWLQVNSGLPTSRDLKLNLFSNIPYIATERGLFKHVEPTQATILINGIGSFVFDGTLQGNPQATTIPPGLTVNITNETQVDAGIYEVTAIIDDPVYFGQANGEIIIKKAPQEISFSVIPDKLSTDPPFTLEATSSSGLPVTFTITEGPATILGSEVSLTGEPGLVYVSAAQDGSTNYRPAPVVTNFFDVFYNPITDSESDLNHSTNIYPIPSSGNITIECGAHFLRSVEILDHTGQKLGYIRLTSESHTADIDLSGYPNGLLMVHVTNSMNQRVTRRIMLVK